MKWVSLLAQANDNNDNIKPVPQRQNCDGANCSSILPEVNAGRGQLENGLSIIFAVFAAVAVVVIVIAAINFATAEGNPENISKAKKTIIYALIGLVISLSAEALVLMVAGRL